MLRANRMAHPTEAAERTAGPKAKSQPGEVKRARKPVLWLMLAPVVATGVLAYLDAEREYRAAMSDFAQEQTTLAGSLAANLGAQLRAARQDAMVLGESHAAAQSPPSSILTRYLTTGVRRPKDGVDSPAQDQGLHLSFPTAGGSVVDLGISLSSLMADLKATEQPNRLLILLRPPGASEFRRTDGHSVSAPAIATAIDDGLSFVRLAPAEAGRLGLPVRTALAGLARVDADGAGHWGVAAVASAERERDRERWAFWRLTLSVATAGGLVLTFGGWALRNQRNELLLQHQLALADLGRERDERLERANRAATMGTLAVGVAHEISTPLGIIAGRAEQLLGRVSADERSSGSVRIILEQIDRIHRVIRGLLGLARGDRPTAEPVAPTALVRDAVALVEHRFEMAGVALETNVDADLPIVRGDPRLLEHAVVNLLLNACDACHSGGRVILSATTDDENRVLRIDVVDDGPGISPENAGRVLEPFFSTKLAGRGTGLGLPLVQEIVASHRGSLELGPVVPHGTRATITFPTSEEPSHA